MIAGSAAFPIELSGSAAYACDRCGAAGFSRPTAA